ncbi:MAG: ArnT family glycosyltransferase [Bradymonadia bacterium]
MSERPLEGLTLPRWLDHGVGGVLALLHFVLVWVTLAGTGVPRDESFYFYAADKAADWVEVALDDDPQTSAFDRKHIDHGFKFNHEHPVLMKTLFGVSHRWLHEKWGWVDDHRSAYRLPTVMMASLAVWLTYLLGMMVAGRGAGVVAGLALIAMPRVFFHSHLACFDAPVTFMWLAVVYTFVRGARSRRWGVASGVVLGLGLATKLNIFFLPFVLLGVAFVDTWSHRKRTGAWRTPKGTRGPLTYYSWIAVSMLILGPLVFLAHWPWLYYDTIKHLGFYIGFHAKHVNYPVDYFGTLYFDNQPYPMSLPFVLSLFTLPVVTLILAKIGGLVVFKRAWAQWRRPAESFAQWGDRRALELCVLVNLMVPFAIIALPNTPIFGGIKHWMPAMPFLAVCAGAGAIRLGRGMFAGRQAAQQRLLGAVVGGLMLIPGFWATLAYHPNGEAYYNALVGGPPGAASLRLSRNFWGYSTIDVLPYLNAHADKGGLAFWHNATGWAVDAYKRDGLLRQDIRNTGDWSPPYSDWGVYHDAREKLPEELDLWRAYGTDWPVEGSFVDGVQVMGLYHRSEPPKVPPVPEGGR